jgi:hypothetical protein
MNINIGRNYGEVLIEELQKTSLSNRFSTAGILQKKIKEFTYDDKDLEHNENLEDNKRNVEVKYIR